MKLQKLSTHFATGIALVVSSAIPAHAASLFTSVGVLSGNPNTTATFEEIALQIISNPAILDPATNPNPFGLSGQQDFDQIPLLTGPGSITSSVNVTNPLSPTVPLTGAATSRVSLSSPSPSVPGSGLVFASTATATVSNPGTNPQTNQFNGAFSAASYIDTFTVGQTGFYTLTFNIDGTTTPDSLTSLARAVGAIAVDNNNDGVFDNQFSDVFTGNDTVFAEFQATAGSPFTLAIAFGSVVALSPFPDTGTANFLNAATLTSITASTGAGGTGTTINNPIFNSTTTGIDLAQVNATPVPFEPSPTLGLLMLGAAWGAGSQLKKYKFASNKIAKN